MNDTQQKLLLRYDQTSLNSDKTDKTDPGSFKKLLKPDKCTLFMISDFK